MAGGMKLGMIKETPRVNLGAKYKMDYCQSSDKPCQARNDGREGGND